jgi:hypothetical protein
MDPAMKAEGAPVRKRAAPKAAKEVRILCSQMPRRCLGGLGRIGRRDANGSLR